MAAPENQITLRILKSDLRMFEALRELVKERSIIAVPKDGDLHRQIYHRGLESLCQEYGIEFLAAGAAAMTPELAESTTSYVSSADRWAAAVAATLPSANPSPETRCLVCNQPMKDHSGVCFQLDPEA